METDLKNKIANIINLQNIDDNTLTNKLKQLLFNVEQQKSTNSDSEMLSNLVSQNLFDLHRMKDKSQIITTGFEDFDNMFGGFLPGEYIVVGGVPAMGKTQFLVNLTLQVSKMLPVLYFTFDLSIPRLTNRFISAISQISIDKIIQNELTIDERDVLNNTGNIIENHKVFVNDGYKDSVSNLLAHCKEQVEQNGVKMIIIDYLQLMTSNRYRNNRDVELSYINRELRSFAKDYQVCVIASSQLNRAVSYRQGVDGKIPQLSDLRDSGSIEQEADKVLFIHRPEYYRITEDECGNSLSGVTFIVMAKNRNGKTGSIKLIMNESRTGYKTSDQFSFSHDRLDELNMPY